MADKQKNGGASSSAAFPLTLDEFCTRLSQNDKRVELIGGFYADEKSAGHTKDTEANYKKRLNNFANKPVA